MPNTPETPIYTDAARLDTDAIYRLASSVSAKFGNEYLETLVRDLHGVMSVNLTMITMGLGNPTRRARARLSWRDGQFGVPVEYDLEGTPCQLVYNGETVIVPNEVAIKFPKEPAHRQSYCGVPLHDGTGSVTGHLAVISNEPVEQTKRLEGILRIFASRAEAELQRIAHDEERERMIKRLALQHNAANQSNLFKSKILGMVAHDLRSPLTAVVSRAEFIQAVTPTEGTLAQQLSKASSTILNASDRMETMINNLLEAAKEEAAAIKLNSVKIPLERPIHSAASLYEEPAAAKQIVIEKELNEGIELVADEDKLIEAMSNLLSNAIKYSSSGCKITLSTARLEDEKMAEIRIADTGQGMTKDDLAAAFRPFRTLSARPTGGETSTGLGLSIVKTIIEAHGGHTLVESDGRNKGTQFTLRLPIVDAAASTNEP
ncbi:MAG: HAMP domain-containing sensor histidine kinase [Filomicrobium sp.]